jgi:hypothetical protein
MKGIRLAAAAVALASVPASASIVFEKTGTGDSGVFQVDLTPGKYVFEVDFDRPAQPSFLFEFQTSYDYVCRPDQDHPDPYFCGGETNPFELDLQAGPRKNSYRGTITLMPARFVPDRPDSFFLGTKYLNDRFVGGSISPDPSDPLSSIGYRFFIDAVPEPASWALMIVGLGLVGLARRRKLPTAHLAIRGDILLS